MNQQQEQIFRDALKSTNLQAIANVAHLFDQLGEPARANALMQRVYSMAYVFGVDYAAVQKRLNDLGASPPLDVDGKWGPKSKAALMAFQKSKGGLAVDGIPGPMSLAALGISTANDVASSTMGHVMPNSDIVDANAYAVGQRAGKEMGLTEQEIQYVIAVAKGEGGFGIGWAHPSAKTLELSKQFGLTGYEGANSNNWGAVQGTGTAGSFPHVDVHADGTPYKANYKAYATPEDAFKDMAKTILGGGPIRKAVGAAEIKNAIARGNLHDAVYAQHANGYFELSPDKYLQAVVSNYNKIKNGIGWPKVLDEYGITVEVAKKVGIATGASGLVLGLIALVAFLLRKQLGLVRV